MKKILCIISFLVLFSPAIARSADPAKRLSGRILINVEEKGEAWYVYPENKKRYFLGRPSDAFSIMRKLGLGISEKNFQQIAQAGMPVEGDKELARRLAGRIVLRTDFYGEAWYINPVNLKKYSLGRPAEAFEIMRELGLGITSLDLAHIHKNGLDESLNEYSSYDHKRKITTAKGEDFYADVVEIDLDDPELRTVTETANSSDCEKDCPARSLGEFVIDNNGFAGINATYFDTSDSKKNYYFFPVYNSELDRMINQEKLKYWTTGPMIAFDKENNFYYFQDSREFKSVDYFEDTHDAELQAALGNKPRLIEDGKDLLINWELDDKQKRAKSWRSALAYKEDSGKGKILLVVARYATVPDLANILKAMEVDYALNLDGGNSTCLFYNDEYMLGPGRDVPNALIFKRQ